MNESLQRVIDLLDATNLFYIATIDKDNQPRVRPFGNAMVYKDRLYICTAKNKPVGEQIKLNNKVELCVFRDGDWVRITGEVFEDDDREARALMLKKNPLMRNLYNEDDGIFEVLYFKKAIVSVNSFYKDTEYFEI